MNVRALLKNVPSQAYIYGTVAVMLVAGYNMWAAHLREDGRTEVVTHQAEVSRDSLAKLIKHKDPKFARDTVRIIRSIATVDTLIQHRIDTAVVHQTDTVKITVAEATAIQDTLRTCRSVVRDCASIQTDLRGMLRADTAIIRGLRRSQPSALTPWKDRLIGGAIIEGLHRLAAALKR